MKKEYLLFGLDCPNCAAKIEKEVGQLEGVRSSTMNLVKQTLTVDIDTSYETALTKKIQVIVHSHEPDVTVSESSTLHPKREQAENQDPGTKRTIIRLIVGALLYAVGIILGKLAFFILSYAILGGNVVTRSVKNIAKGRIFDEHFLMTLSTIGAFVIGEYPEAVAVMLFYQIGELFQDMAVKRSRRSISDLMDIRPDTATVQRNQEFLVVSSETVAVGEVIVVKPGEKIPLDGIILQGQSTLDTKALTGESLPRGVQAGDEVLSGCINQNGMLTIRVTKGFGESTATKIIDLVENASAQKAPTENFITTFARYYTPVVVMLATLLAIIPPLFFHGEWVDWIHRGFVFLVISCPCALVISIPLTFFGGIGTASKHGVLVKGSNYLEALNHVRTIVFDKTGTLTKGNFRVMEILPAQGFSSETVLRYAAQAEYHSKHPIAQSILTAYGEEPDPLPLTKFEEFAGHGIRVNTSKQTILCGNTQLMEAEGITFTPCDQVGTKVYVAVDGKFAGCILIADEIKTDSIAAVKQLKQMGIEKIVMLTGDNEQIGQSVANRLGLDACYSQLLPDQKTEMLGRLDSQKRPRSKLAFVGDGINDAPVLARADIGIAMGGLGSDAAIEAADVVLMTDEPSKLVDAISIARETRRIVIQNIVMALSIKTAFLLLGAFGIAGMWEAVFGDVGVTLLAVLNSMRILKK